MNNSRFKFRAWDLLNHRMWPVVSPDFILKRCIIGVSPEWQENAIYEMRLEDLIIQQFTGLEDKYGNEIYEGDILRFPFVIKSGEVKLDMIGVVKYGYFGCYEIEINANEEISNPALGIYFKETVEVIGNIYENPELMEAHNETK